MIEYVDGNIIGAGLYLQYRQIKPVNGHWKTHVKIDNENEGIKHREKMKKCHKYYRKNVKYRIIEVKIKVRKI